MGNAAAKREAVASAISRGDDIKLAGMLDQLSADDRLNGKYYDEGDEDGRTPLHHASSMGFVVGVELLLRTGANKNELDSTGKTPLYLAVSNEQKDVVELLIRNRVDLDHSFTATSQLDGEVQHEPPLHHAADCGLLDMVHVLLRAGADPNKRYSDLIDKKFSSCTPLHRASLNGHSDVIQLLIDAGGGVNNAEGDGNTPLHLAALRGHLATCKVLVESGQADLDKRNNKNYTAVDLARRGGFKEIEEYFEQTLQTCLSQDPMQRQSMSLKAAMAKKDTSTAAAMARRANADEGNHLGVLSPPPTEKKLFVAFRNMTQSMSKMVTGYRMGSQQGGGDTDDVGSSYIESVGQSSSYYQSGDDYDCEPQSEALVTDRSYLGRPFSERRLSVSDKCIYPKQDATAAAVASEGIGKELKLPSLFLPSTTSSSSYHSSSANSGQSSVSTHVSGQRLGNTTPVNLGGNDGDSCGGSPRGAMMRGGLAFMPSMLQTASILALSMRGNRFCSEDDSEGSDNDGDPTNESGSIEQLRNLLEQHNIGRHGTQSDDPYKDKNGEDDASDSDDDDDVHDVFASSYERQQRKSTPARSPVRSKAPSGFQSLRSSIKQTFAPEQESVSPLPGTSPTQRLLSATGKLSLPYLTAAGLGSSNKQVTGNESTVVNAKLHANGHNRSGTSTPTMPRLTTATAAMSTMGTLSAAASALSSPSLRSPRR